MLKAIDYIAEFMYTSKTAVYDQWLAVFIGFSWFSKTNYFVQIFRLYDIHLVNKDLPFL